MTVAASASEISFIGTGDCGPVHGPGDGFPIERYTEHVRPTLAGIDLKFANCERQYSSRGKANELAPHGRQPPEMAKIFTDCGFDAVTIANNHMYDYGPEALLDTRALLIEKRIAVTGAGRDLDEARKPAIVEKNGVKVGFLGYCSVIPEGGEAAPGKVGIAPLRVVTSYEGRGPHASPRVLTRPDEGDMKVILDDIAALRREVDIVVVAFHWGLVWVPRVIADYQVTAAHACIDAGADLILGHHAHVPKAIGAYDGKVCFYSLSNFIMSSTAKSEHGRAEFEKRYGVKLDPDYPHLPYGEDAKRSLIAKAVFTQQGLQKASFLPVLIDRELRPEPLRQGDPRFADAVRYMEWASEGFPHAFTVEGDEVIVR
jgi:poly-gamma-glutamate synthesis protein (capsule biosynthesis protein)